jgi:hypothetical protein
MISDVGRDELRLTCGGDQRVDHTRRRPVKRSGSTCDHDSSCFLRLTPYGDGFDSFGQDVEHEGRDGRDGQAGGHDLEFGEPVADDVADVGAPCQAWPHSEQRVAGFGSACDPDLSFKLRDLDDLGMGERVVRGDADSKLAL